MWAVEVENLFYTHAPGTPYEHTALKGVSLKVGRGRIAAIIGPTGSGKSTLIQHFNGLLAPQRGSVKIFGKSASDKAVRKSLWKSVGLVFQYPEKQLFEETVYDDIAFGPKNLGLNKQQIQGRVIKALDFTNLSQEILTRSPHVLSGGMKRRTAIAGILAMKPEILVLDEPTAGMDPDTKKSFLANIKKLQQSNTITIIMVTHSMEDAALIADELLVINKGEIILNGTPREIFTQAEQLTNIGLDVPVEVALMIKLQRRGIPVSTSVLGVNEAVAEICRNIKSRS
ncbi:MAG: energy-coupling factor transporter ATPase [Firmicutes bacterium]|nr:energy-coupling factor transporter ATPase [Bacillota bacterium]